MDLRHFPLLQDLVGAEHAHQRRLLLIQLNIVVLPILEERNEARGRNDRLLERFLSGGEVLGRRTGVVLAQGSSRPAESIVEVHVVVRVVVRVGRLAVVAALLIAFRARGLLLVREDGLCLALGALLLLGDLLVNGHGVCGLLERELERREKREVEVKFNFKLDGIRRPPSSRLSFLRVEGAKLRVAMHVRDQTGKSTGLRRRENATKDGEQKEMKTNEVRRRELLCLRH